jgi:hypothetical protein
MFEKKPIEKDRKELPDQSLKIKTWLKRPCNKSNPKT